MKTPLTISLYIGRRFIAALGMGLAVCAALVFLVDMLESLPRFAGNGGFGIALSIAFLRLPIFIQSFLPFAVLFGGIICFSRLTRTRELIAARNAGVSAWQFLTPAFFIAVMAGALFVTLLSPVASAMKSKSEQISEKYVASPLSKLSVSKSGLWLRQQDNELGGETLIHAARVSQTSSTLYDVVVFRFAAGDKFVSRIDAKTAKLAGGKLVMTGALVNSRGKQAMRDDIYEFPTNLSLEQIQDSFGDPENLSFWELSGFIKTLEEAGFSALRHRLYFHTMLSMPVMLASMVLIAAVFSLKYSRKPRTGLLIASGVFTGFVFYFISRIVASLAIAGTLPITLAAWIPSGVLILAGTALLLHMEDG